MPECRQNVRQLYPPFVGHCVTNVSPYYWFTTRTTFYRCGNERPYSKPYLRLSSVYTVISSITASSAAPILL